MNQLEDRRPVAATTTISRHPNVIGEDLAQLLLEHPGIELASIRLIPSTEHDGVGIVGRVGPIAEPDCPSCHTTAGHPHTDYCTPGTPPCRCHLVRYGSREAWGNPGPWHAQDCPRWEAEKP